MSNLGNILSEGYTLKAIGEYFNLHYLTVSGILKNYKPKKHKLENHK